MARIKYYYDTERCRYERITPNIWTILLNLFGFLLLSFVFAVGLVFVYDHYFETPSEIILNSENESYRLEIEVTEKLVRDLEKDIRRLQKRDKEVYKIITGVDSIPYANEDIDYTSTDEYDKALKGKKGALKELIDVKMQQLSKLKNQMEQQNSAYTFYSKIRGFEEKRRQATPWITPIGKDNKYRVASGFGRRKHPVLGIWKMHTGLDYACKKGTPIRATGNGIVQKVKKSCCKGYGNYVDLDHGFGFKTRYGHMSKVLVRQGQKVKRGDIIGEVGSTGTSTGNHLHYEVFKNNKQINPVLFVHDLNPEEYEEMLQIASEENEALSIPDE